MKKKNEKVFLVAQNVRYCSYFSAPNSNKRMNSFEFIRLKSINLIRIIFTVRSFISSSKIRAAAAAGRNTYFLKT